MAEIASLTAQNPHEPKFISSIHSKNESSCVEGASECYAAFDDEIPTVDYSLLFSDDAHQQSLALQHLGNACHDFGFFYLVNHDIPDAVLDNLFKGIYDFFDPKALEERRIYKIVGPKDRIRWDQNCTSGENREYLKVITHPQYHFPPNPSGFSEVLEDYYEEMRKIVFGLAKALSKTLGLEEDYIEKSFNLKSGFDVSALNLYPPKYKTKGRIGVGDHTDPGFIVTLVQDVNGGLQILFHKGKWINAYIPHHAILIQLGDHLEILTNGKYKSHIHHVVVDNNKVKRISVATLHGPSLDKFMSPAPEFVDEDHPLGYTGMTYKESLEANGGHEIDVQSSLAQLRL